MTSALANSPDTNPYAVFPTDSRAEDREVSGELIVLQGELGLDQLLRAGRLCVGSQLRRVRPLVLTALLFLSIAGSSYGLWFKQTRFALGTSFQTAAAGLMLMAITRRHGSTTLKISFRLGLRKPERFYCAISDGGVKMIVPRLTLDDPWSGYSGFTESDDMILLWRKTQYVPLPKEFSANEGEWQRLRECLHARLPLRRM